jgi:hypothetical protein
MNKNVNLAEPRIQIIKNIKVDCSVPMFQLLKTNAPATDNHNLSQICRIDEEVNKDEIYFSDFVAIFWPKDGKGSFEKAMKLAKKNNLKTINIRELLSICRKSYDIYEDLKLDIIKLVLTESLSEKECYMAHIEAMADVRVYPEKKEEMRTGDFLFVFKKT